MRPYSDLLRDIHFPEKPIKLNTTILHYREFGESIASLNEIHWRIFVKMPLIDKPRTTLRKLLGLARNAKSLLRPKAQ
jgi:hypothetical protein